MNIKPVVGATHGAIRQIISENFGEVEEAVTDLLARIILLEAGGNSSALDITYITGSHLETFDLSYNDYFLDKTDPIPKDKYLGRILLSVGGSGVNPNAYFRIESYGGAAGNPFKLTLFDDNGTGVTKINSTDVISNGQYKIILGKTNGNGAGGSGLTAVGLYDFFYDRDSVTTDELWGAIVKIDKALKNAPVNDKWIVEDTTLTAIGEPTPNTHALKLIGLDHNEQLSPKLIAGNWSVITPFPYPNTPAVPSFTGSLKLGAIGDSNTALQYESPVNVLKRVLPNASSLTYLNRGLGGSTVSHWMPSTDLYKQVVAEFKTASVNVISLNLGTNIDIAGGQTVDSFMTDLATIVNQLYTDIPTLKKIVLQEVISRYGDPKVIDINSRLPNFGNNTLFGPTGVYQFAHDYPNYFRADGLHFRIYRAMINQHVAGVVKALPFL